MDIMTIDLSTVFTLVVKLLALVAVALISFMFVCWPINDQPTSKIQYSVWGLVIVIVTMIIFGFIKVQL